MGVGGMGFATFGCQDARGAGELILLMGISEGIKDFDQFLGNLVNFLRCIEPPDAEPQRSVGQIIVTAQSSEDVGWGAAGRATG